MKSLTHSAFVLVLAAGSLVAQEDRGQMSFIRMSPILNAIDVNQDGILSAAEIADAAARIQKLDKNADGKLTREEAGLQMGLRGGRGRGEGGRGGEAPPAQPPTTEELTSTLMAFDSNRDGKLQKSEVPERMQGLFERGDTDHDGVLTRDEITKLAEANRQQAETGGQGRRGEGRGRGGRGPRDIDVAFNALDTDHNGEISADEMSNSLVSLKALDKNHDGQITQDEVAPIFGGRQAGRGPGGPDH
jgi:Ca2+-binding EF-hand superfamily protein